MTRGQYFAMCAIGYIAVFALIHSLSLARSLNGGIIRKNPRTLV